MKIYTKTGDKGQSSLFNGERHSKTSIFFDILGEIDTLNAQIGIAISLTTTIELKNKLIFTQQKLMSLSAEIAKVSTPRNQITSDDIQSLEDQIDHYWDQTPPLKNLILPGGSQLGAQIHLIRTQVRNVERYFLKLLDTIQPENTYIGPYLNRLSDYFFALARWVNHQHQSPEQTWN